MFIHIFTIFSSLWSIIKILFSTWYNFYFSWKPSYIISQRAGLIAAVFTFPLSKNIFTWASVLKDFTGYKSFLNNFFIPFKGIIPLSSNLHCQPMRRQPSFLPCSLYVTCLLTLAIFKICLSVCLSVCLPIYYLCIIHLYLCLSFQQFAYVEVARSCLYCSGLLSTLVSFTEFKKVLDIVLFLHKSLWACLVYEFQL